MRSIVPSRTIARRTHAQLEIAFVLVSGGIFLAVLGLALYVIPLTARESVYANLFNAGRAVFLFLGFVSALVGMGLAIRAATTRTENNLALLAARVLEKQFDDHHTFVRNVNRRKLGYIDALIIGPPGVLVLRIVDYTGTFLNEGSRWLKADASGEWHPMSNSPSREAIEDVKSLRRFFEARGLHDVPVFGAVVFIPDDPDAKLTLKEPAILATHLSSLYRRLQPNYLARERISNQAVQQVVRFFDDA